MHTNTFNLLTLTLLEGSMLPFQVSIDSFIMKTDLRYLFALALLSMASCSKDNLSQPENPQTSKPQEAIVLTADETECLPLFETDYNRSHKEVLALADGLMKQIAKEEQQTKVAIPARTAVLSDSIVLAIPMTKSATAQMPQEAKIYVVNFGKKAGFSLIAGDKRVQSAVLAYDGSGEFDVNTDNPGAQLAMELMKEYIQSEIERMEAMRGDSVYTTLEAKYGFGADANTSEQTPRTRSSFQQPQFVAMDGMPGSSPDNPYGTRQGSNWQVVSNGLTWYWAPVDNIVDAENVCYQEMMTLVYPMIPAQWGQDWPYNTEVKKVIGAPKTGCGPTAMAQIMAYHRKPAGYMWDDYGYNLLEKLDFEHNRSFAWESKSSTIITNVGQLFKDIGLKVGMQYFPSGSGAHSNRVPNAFSQYGYSTSKLIDINIQSLIDYLQDNKKPVYTRGSHVGGGHAWVVDGYGQKADYNMIYKNCYYQGEYVGYLKTVKVNFTMDEYYYHCNWGWNGKDNGWYLAGIFYPPSHSQYDRNLLMLTEIQ